MTAPNHTLWLDEDRKMAEEIFKSEFTIAARDLCPPANWTLPPKSEPLGPVFHQATAYMNGVLEAAMWTDAGLPEHTYPYREHREAHEHEVFLREVEGQEKTRWGATNRPMPKPGSTWASPGSDPAWHEPREWTLDSLRVLWGRAREYEPLPGRAGRARDVSLIRKAGRLAMADALRRNFGFPPVQADVVTAFVEWACVELWERLTDEGHLLVLRGRLLAGTGGIREIPREAQVSGVVRQATEKARALHAQTGGEVSIGDVSEACDELTEGREAALAQPAAAGEPLKGLRVAKDRVEYNAFLPN